MEGFENIANDAMRQEPYSASQTRWSRYFSGPSEKIDGRVIDELRMTIRDAISQTGSLQQSKKQKKGEGGPSGA